MPERETYVYQGPVQDYTEHGRRVIEQGELQPDAAKKMIEDRIKAAERGELKSLLASILDRGIIEDRLHVDLPSDVYGEWVRRDPLEVARMKALGFQIDNKYASQRAIHEDGTDANIVGDVIFMTCDMLRHEIIEEIRHEQKLAVHMKKRTKSGDKNKEERDLEEITEKEYGKLGVKAVTESREHRANFEDIRDALKSADAQVKPFHQKE